MAYQCQLGISQCVNLYSTGALVRPIGAHWDLWQSEHAARLVNFPTGWTETLCGYLGETGSKETWLMKQQYMW